MDRKERGAVCVSRPDWRQTTAAEPQVRITAFLGRCDPHPPAVVVQVDDPDDEFPHHTYYFHRRAEVQRLADELTTALERADRTGTWKHLESLGFR